jgi:phosphonate transport system ATP-binding protein
VSVHNGFGGLALDGQRDASKVPGGEDAFPLVKVEGVSKSFSERKAVAGVSFTLTKREMAAVLGPSGAGKTTLFRCLTGLLEPDEGRIWFAGVEMARMPAESRRQIALIFQDYNLVRRLTAFENVLGGRLGHIAPWRGVFRRFERPAKLKAFECLERVGMLDHAHDRADRLSGGQQQRVAIARALAQEPRLIVADEPVASLDPASAASVLQLLQNIARSEGVAVILSLHQVGYARSFADRIIGLVGGRIIADAPAGMLKDEDFTALYEAGASSQGIMKPPPDQPHGTLPSNRE